MAAAQEDNRFEELLHQCGRWDEGMAENEEIRAFLCAKLDGMLADDNMDTMSEPPRNISTVFARAWTVIQGMSADVAASVLAIFQPSPRFPPNDDRARRRAVFAMAELVVQFNWDGVPSMQLALPYLRAWLRAQLQAPWMVSATVAAQLGPASPPGRAHRERFERHFASLFDPKHLQTLEGAEAVVFNVGLVERMQTLVDRIDEAGDALVAGLDDADNNVFGRLRNVAEQHELLSDDALGALEAASQAFYGDAVATMRRAIAGIQRFIDARAAAVAPPVPAAGENAMVLEEEEEEEEPPASQPVWSPPPAPRASPPRASPPRAPRPAVRAPPPLLDEEGMDPELLAAIRELDELRGPSADFAGIYARVMAQAPQRREPARYVVPAPRAEAPPVRAVSVDDEEAARKAKEMAEKEKERKRLKNERDAARKRQNRAEAAAAKEEAEAAAAKKKAKKEKKKAKKARKAEKEKRKSEKKKKAAADKEPAGGGGSKRAAPSDEAAKAPKKKKARPTADAPPAPGPVAIVVPGVEGAEEVEEEFGDSALEEALEEDAKLRAPRVLAESDLAGSLRAREQEAWDSLRSGSPGDTDDATTGRLFGTAWEYVKFWNTKLLSTKTGKKSALSLAHLGCLGKALADGLRAVYGPPVADERNPDSDVARKRGEVLILGLTDARVPLAIEEMVTPRAVAVYAGGDNDAAADAFGRLEFNKLRATHDVGAATERLERVRYLLNDRDVQHNLDSTEVPVSCLVVLAYSMDDILGEQVLADVLTSVAARDIALAIVIDKHSGRGDGEPPAVQALVAAGFVAASQGPSGPRPGRPTTDKYAAWFCVRPRAGDALRAAADARPPAGRREEEEEEVAVLPPVGGQPAPVRVVVPPPSPLSPVMELAKHLTKSEMDAWARTYPKPAVAGQHPSRLEGETSPSFLSNDGLKDDDERPASHWNQSLGDVVYADRRTVDPYHVAQLGSIGNAISGWVAYARMWRAPTTLDVLIVGATSGRVPMALADAGLYDQPIRVFGSARYQDKFEAYVDAVEAREREEIRSEDEVSAVTNRLRELTAAVKYVTGDQLEDDRATPSVDCLVVLTDDQALGSTLLLQDALASRLCASAELVVVLAPSDLGPDDATDRNAVMAKLGGFVPAPSADGCSTLARPGRTPDDGPFQAHFYVRPPPAPASSSEEEEEEED